MPMRRTVSWIDFFRGNPASSLTRDASTVGIHDATPVGRPRSRGSPSRPVQRSVSNLARRMKRLLFQDEVAQRMQIDALWFPSVRFQAGIHCVPAFDPE